ncbi:hypothetical protein Zmor_003645 [Zophobas morio]|uniref:Uncharacterized protein n=1 Tax=Zophobas morio TaxID=2755281 RepID=A0AA38M1J5_9CUCU|nr:hypothetical protein Zmor_003645 [Zophobas morio]
MSNFVVPAPLNLNGNLYGNWKKSKKSFNIYMTASSYHKEPEERQVAILLNLIGPEAVELHETFKYGKGDEKKIEKVLQAFEEYCNPKKNILHARFLFYNRKQREGKPFDTFLTDCKTLVQACDFKNADELLRDKIVLDAAENFELLNW